jgi:hypothetical protein
MGRALYGFLIDENALHLGLLFPPGRAVTVEDLDMRGASDDAVILEGDRRELIVVTANRDDYRERFIAHASKGGKRKCTDLYGLVMFYGEKQDQVKHFPLAQIERRLRLDRKPIKWRDVYQQNLLVRVKSGGVTVERLPRCPYCVREGPA